MNSRPFLIVDDQPISLEQSLQYLQTTGKLGPLIGDILRQHIIEQELQNRPELAVQDHFVQQTEINFRLQNQLTDPKKFQEWLAQNGKTYPVFHQQVKLSLQVNNLKAQIIAPQLTEYFNERKPLLDQVILSRLIVSSKQLADDLQSKITAGASFEQLVREYSIANDKVMNGMMGAISIAKISPSMRADIESANPGNLVGPIQLEDNWGLFRVEEFLPATLENSQLKESLENEIFDRWLGEKLQKMNVQVQLSVENPA